jgi:hypothetical protein
MSQRHLSRDPRLTEPRLTEPRLADPRLADPRLGPTSPRGGRDAQPEKRRSVLPSVIAAFVVVGLSGFLLSGRGHPTATGWQNLHPPFVPTQLTPDGVPARPVLPVPAR